MKRQVYNPYLPLNEYIPDGEPHVFDDRIYVFGSHDKEDGETFCMLDYVFWSAPVDDLSSWSNNGVSYRAEQDPLYSENNKYLYAPDVVKGSDGKYYLYYCLSGYKGQGGYTNPISVAVSDRPDGPYEYLGYVRNKDGSPMMEHINFDPALINDEGQIRL
ncbi:MAG: family 43 glycosylhydrolase, partial [Erysipelotrichaceae bacterium]|nr:family 43 glycosylhydrolase [Erysipelotrichaceae bacterium]